jgi:hypothetical protein
MAINCLTTDNILQYTTIQTTFDNKMARRSVILCFSLFTPYLAKSFSVHNPHQTVKCSCRRASRDDRGATHQPQSREYRWLRKGLLLSSFTDGLKPNQQAKDFLMNGLVTSLWQEYLSHVERQVEDSARASPCCGPTDLESLVKMETADEALDHDSVGWEKRLAFLKQESSSISKDLELRMVYIPTAMYALRSDSKRSPGKQRQRARADGKKRRNEIVKLLGQELSTVVADDDKDVNVLAVSLDLDDGSIKQPEGSSDDSKFPSNGKEALESWKPHFIYVQGGNTFWLYHCMEKSDNDWRNLLLDAVTGDNAAVYCGTSAGAILAGSSMETATWKGWDDPSVVPDKPSYEDWTGIYGLALAGNASVFPHMGDQWQSLVNDKQTNLDDTTVYLLRDEESLCVDGSSQTVELISC